MALQTLPYQMDCTQSLVELFCHSFPEIDRRVIKATVLEYGNDIESAINDLVDISDRIKDTSFIDRLKVQCCSLLCPAKDAAEQVRIEEEKSQVVEGLPQTIFKRFGSPSENIVPDASDLQGDFHSAYVVEHSSSSNNIIAETLAINGARSETLNSIDIVNVASSLECTVQEARTDIDDVINLVKEVSDLRVKADQERIAAQNAEIEAGRGGEDLLMKACEVNKQTQKKKQDNLKLSLEIHDEKSVLALEAEELNVCLEHMKQQKEKAVTTLHEIRDTLQSCYDTALEDRKMAEEDRQLKEEKAGKVLEQEEDLMAIIEQETKTLKMEAEACTLLRDILVDHGSIVDALQREINNLCEDVKYLKEQVQGVRSSMSAALTQKPAQNSDAFYSLRRSHSTLSAASSGEMTNSLASQSSASTLRDDVGKSQFLYSSGTHGSIVSKSFDGTTEDSSISFMNNARGSRGSMPMQELQNSYDSEVPGLFPFRNGVNIDLNKTVVTYHPFGERGDDSNGYGHMQGLSHQHRAFGKPGDGYGYAQGLSHQHCAFGKHGDDSNGNVYTQDLSHQHRAFGEHGDIKIDSSYPLVARSNNSWRNLAAEEFASSIPWGKNPPQFKQLN